MTTSSPSSDPSDISTAGAEQSVERLTTRRISAPKLGFGTWKLHGAYGRAAIERALQIGYHHIDTAAAYENEALVGRAIKNSQISRDELFVTTKVWWKDLDASSLFPAVEASLERLGLDHVDLLLAHWPNPDVPMFETLSMMTSVRDQGMTKHIGVSNFTPTLLRKAMTLAPVGCIQVEYHPYLAQTVVRDIAAEHGLMLTAYSPLAQGQVFDDDVITKIGRRHGKTAGQVTLRWLLQQDNVAAIPRSESPAHIADNFDVFDFKLNDEEMQTMHARARGKRIIDPSFAPQWENRTSALS